MARHFHAAPLLAQHALFVDQEGAAVNAEVFLAVELFQLDHVEQLAQGLVLVRDQLEREGLLALEVFMGLQAVTRDAKDQRIGGLEVGITVAKALAFSGAAWCAVFRVELNQHLLAAQGSQGNAHATGGLSLKVVNRLIDDYSHGQLLTGSVGAKVRSARPG